MGASKKSYRKPQCTEDKVACLETMTLRFGLDWLKLSNYRYLTLV